MNSTKLNLTFLLLFCSSFLYAQGVDPGTANLFVQDELKLIASDFSFTEGCSPDKHGNVFFTDQPKDKIWKYSTDGKLSVFLDKSGRANGTHFDAKGNLVACADEKGELWSIKPNGKIKVLLADFQGKEFNGPNDLWINAQGAIYFTDPYYKRDYWTRTGRDLASNDVYYLPIGAKQARRVADGMIRPNGLVGTPDGKYLYVADIGAGKTFRYSIENNGDLAGKELLMAYGSDGMTLDEKGNIYLTARDGVLIFNSKGEMIAKIKVPHAPSNLCFSGKDKNILFITAREAIYTLPMKVKGIE
ncbi:SMP-30/gluconolactonase/LRE family protein [Pedobacter gandavensis]|uniref:SMP-30/gluconolactonase/LRE family protein n=1 Tax=Pedobacter gandavensis TaxID=2679963 RepID=A0ABR6EQV2_9SPHI|nr:SMP-30/gluconolactonase/LRE family protein [Pedobacter gandavensis]MBB2147625.1 SMP-30/gluconolactonase/LRE family protein [Pedobacter gandavensis]